MTFPDNITILRMMRLFMTLTVALLCVGCGEESNPAGGDGQDSPTRVSIPLEGALTNVELRANQTTRVQLTLQVPPDLGAIATAEIDVAASAQHVTVNTTTAAKLRGLVSLVTGQQTGQAYIRVGNDPATVCTDGVLYGPYPVSPAFLSLPSPELVALDNPTVQILNAGSVVICMDIFSDVNATFSIDQLETNVTSATCETPADFSGVWAGTYECTNSCSGVPFGDTVEITVTQNGDIASYVDLVGDTYTGTVCGNLFRFERVESDEIERGTMILDDANHATKRSTWHDRTTPFCSGDCIDVLTKLSGS